MRELVVASALLSLLGCNWGPRGTTNGVVNANAAAAPVSKWTATEFPLTIYHDKSPFESASAQGFWQSTSPAKDRQLLGPIAVKISCYGDEKVCRETDASVQLGILESSTSKYDVASWTDSGIVADDSDEGECGIGHRLVLDFKSNSVTVTDYPKKMNTSPQCKAVQDANSFALRGGQLMLYPPAAWDLPERNGKK